MNNIISNAISKKDIMESISSAPNKDEKIIKSAVHRNSQLTKPVGALGRLEELAIWYCGWRQDPKALIKNPQVIVFAGNHGVASLGVSAFPQEVTAQMVINFERQGAAINQLCEVAGATLKVHSLELDKPTNDFTKGAALSSDEFETALLVGWNSVDNAADLLVVGEMGIGNTTSAAALACGLFGGVAEDWVGRGTGVTDEGLILKVSVVKDGLKANEAALSNPLEVLRCLGGREMVAMVGAISRARSLRIPVILDGFICSTSAAVLEKYKPGFLDHCVAGHLSSEGAHSKVLKQLNKTPLIDLNLRLGEASGGTLAINIIKSALACHSGMATFEEAAVSGKS
jgi:nicotinate-nucleotide--dimethylbenzimidazole phosphoribosyltransferase